MKTIKLKPVPASAYNEQRPANNLLLAHVRELEKAVRKAGRRVQTAAPRTEAEVAAYIRHLNRALFHQTLLPAIRRRPLKGKMIVAIARQKESRSGAPARPTRRKTAKAAPKTKTKRKKSPKGRKR